MHHKIAHYNKNNCFTVSFYANYSFLFFFCHLIWFLTWCFTSFLRCGFYSVICVCVSQVLTSGLYYYYVSELGFYWSLMFSQFTDIKRKVSDSESNAIYSFLLCLVHYSIHFSPLSTTPDVHIQSSLFIYISTLKVKILLFYILNKALFSTALSCDTD